VTLELTLYVILAFLVPGVIAGCSLALFGGEPRKLLLELLRNPSAGRGVLFVAASLAFGVILDSLRTVVVDPLARTFGKRALPSDYLSKITKDNLPVFQLFLDRTLEYYRLNANLTFAVAAAAMAYFLKGGGYLVSLGLWLMVLLLFWRSVVARDEMAWTMEQLAKGESKMCQSLPCIGAKVALLRTLVVSQIRVPKGTVGEVEREYLEDRAVEVYFENHIVCARLAETDVLEIRDEGSEPPVLPPEYGPVRGGPLKV